MILRYYLKIVVIVYSNDWETLGMFQPGYIFYNHKVFYGAILSFVIIVKELIKYNND